MTQLIRVAKTKLTDILKLAQLFEQKATELSKLGNAFARK